MYGGLEIVFISILFFGILKDKIDDRHPVNLTVTNPLGQKKMERQVRFL